MQRNCEDHLMVQLKLRIDQGFLSIIKKGLYIFSGIGKPDLMIGRNLI